VIKLAAVLISTFCNAECDVNTEGNLPADYQGIISVTKDGDECISWSSVDKDWLYDTVVGDHNY